MDLQVTASGFVCRPALTLCFNAPAIPHSGSVTLAIPALLTRPGIPHTAEVASSCAITTPPPSISTTVETAPPPQRPTVTVEDLRAGQCVEVQQFQPDPTKPGSQDVKVYLVRCEVREGVFQVNLITSSEDQCNVRVVANRADTLFACISEFRG